LHQLSVLINFVYELLPYTLCYWKQSWRWPYPHTTSGRSSACQKK